MESEMIDFVLEQNKTPYLPMPENIYGNGGTRNGSFYAEFNPNAAQIAYRDYEKMFNACVKFALELKEKHNVCTNYPNGEDGVEWKPDFSNNAENQLWGLEGINGYADNTKD